MRSTWWFVGLSALSLACGGAEHGPRANGAPTEDVDAFAGTPNAPSDEPRPGLDAPPAPAPERDGAAPPRPAPDAGTPANLRDAAPARPDGAAAPDGPTSAPGCRTGDYPVCLDFEAMALDPKWRGASATVKVETGRAAHGEWAVHFSGLAPGVSRTIGTTQLGTITSVMWGRFYLYMSAGAPNGHGALVSATDQAGNWYEMGFQFSDYFADWHVPAGVPERWMNSKTPIPKEKWACVEFLFDGSKAAVAQLWADGVEVKFTQTATSPPVATVQQFKRVDFGPRLYHGTSLSDYSGTTPPVLTDVWIDDIALDSKRIGCVQ